MTEKIIKWRSVKKDGLPDKSGKYLTYHISKDYLSDLWFSAKHQAFNAFDTMKDSTNELDVDYWCPIDEIVPEEAEDEKAD